MFPTTKITKLVYFELIFYWYINTISHMGLWWLSKNIKKVVELIFIEETLRSILFREGCICGSLNLLQSFTFTFQETKCKAFDKQR